MTARRRSATSSAGTTRTTSCSGGDDDFDVPSFLSELRGLNPGRRDPTQVLHPTVCRRCTWRSPTPRVATAFPWASPSAEPEQRRRRAVLHRGTWLRQVHGDRVVEVGCPGEWTGAEADAAVTTIWGRCWRCTPPTAPGRPGRRRRRPVTGSRCGSSAPRTPGGGTGRRRGRGHRRAHAPDGCRQVDWDLGTVHLAGAYASAQASSTSCANGSARGGGHHARRRAGPRPAGRGARRSGPGGVDSGVGTDRPWCRAPPRRRLLALVEGPAGRGPPGGGGVAGPRRPRPPVAP